MKLTETKGNGLALIVFLFLVLICSFHSRDANAASLNQKNNSQKSRAFSEENLPPNPTANDIFVIQMAPGFTQINPNDPNTFPQSFTYALEENAANGSVSIRGNKFFYTAKAGFTGSDSFTVKVTDNGVPALSGFKTVRVMVAANNLPSVSGNDIITFQSKPATVQISFTDSDQGQGHSFLISSKPAHGVASIDSNGLLTYSPSVGYSGSDSLIVAVKDTAIPAGIGTKSININVTPNAIPVVIGNDFSTFQSKPTTTQIGFSDLDQNQRYTFFIVTKPASGKVLLTQDGVLTYTPNVGYSGPDAVTVGVSDNAVYLQVSVKKFYTSTLHQILYLSFQLQI